MGSLFRSSGMSSQQRNDEVTPGMQHEHGGIELFAADQGSDQAGHGSGGSHQNQRYAGAPVVLECSLEVLIRRHDTGDLALLNKPIEQGQGG